MPGIPETRPAVILLDPSREALSGVSTHLSPLFGSALARQFASLDRRRAPEPAR